MKVVFLFGNGFDLNCGLKSSYNNMYKGYCESKSTSEAISKFKLEIDHNIDKWSDFESAIAQYAAKLTNEKELLECVRDFKKYLTQYLIKENRKFCEQMTALSYKGLIVEEYKKSFESFYDRCGFPMSYVKSIEKRKMLEGMSIQVIDFNYTSTIELLNGLIQKERPIDTGSIIHIHGDLRTDDIVLGVDNLGQIKAKYELSHSFERGIVKPIFNKEYDSDKLAKAELAIRNADIICSFGMSFGITDNSWKQLIIDSLGNNEQSLIYFDYEMSQKEGMTIDQKMEESDLFKSQLSEKWGMDIPDGVFSKIYIPCGKNNGKVSDC